MIPSEFCIGRVVGFPL